MSVWSRYPETERRQYVKFLQAYGSLTALFLQKGSAEVPYLDSKFQETIYGKVFESQNTDIGNTPHDIVSTFGGERIGIGLKTWTRSRGSFQKVMQLKSYKKEIDAVGDDPFDVAYTVSKIKNDRLFMDYERLGLSKTSNIYHYVTRDDDSFTIQETSYPVVSLNAINNVCKSKSSISWSDGIKDYKYTLGDSTIWMFFDKSREDTVVVDQFQVEIMDDPFSFLLRAYDDLYQHLYVANQNNSIDVAYLPLYSYSKGEVEAKSGLNAWNGAPKNKGGNTPRPLGEIYIPVPMEFHKKFPNFFTDNIFDNIKEKRPVEFTLILPNGVEMPGRLTGDNMKNFQSGSNTIRKPDGSRWGQADLGNWLLVKVLGLRDRQLVTRAWLDERGVDSVKLWHDKCNKSRIYIDFAESGSFDEFMNGELG